MPNLAALTSQLTPFHVARYARARGWEEVAGVKGRLWVFRDPTDPLRQVQIPMDVEDPAWPDAAIDAAGRFARRERRDALFVVEDILHVDADVVRVRVDTSDSRTGEISLGFDLVLRDGVRRALLASACSVVSPAAFHPRMSFAEAETMLAGCRTGTALGSYIVKVACPLGIDMMLPSMDDPPFTRKVTTHLMRAAAELVSLVEGGADRVSEFIDSHAHEPVISANFCEALSRLQPSSEGYVEITTDWASVLPNPSAPRARAVIRSEYFAAIGEIGQRLRPPVPQLADEWIIGTVEALHGDTGSDGRRSGEVTLALLLPESGDQVRARARLSPEAYTLAVEVHGEGRSYVRVRGRLMRGGRFSRIDPVQGFERLAKST